MLSRAPKKGISVNFDLSEQEELIKALTERFVGDRYDSESRRAYLAGANGFSADNWRLLGELGLLAAPFPAEAGGLDLDATGIATVFEALGHGLAVEPLIENVVLAGRLFAATAGPDLRDEWLPAILSGERRIALAHFEMGGRPGRLRVTCRADRDGPSLRLTGAKACVPAGGGADGYLVSARTRGEAQEAAGVGLYFVPSDAAGLRIETWRLADGSSAASLDLAATPVAPGHCLSGGSTEIEEAEVLASLARTAESIGIMNRLFADTLDYLRTREQFGAKLGSFQAIQHRMVAQYSKLEQCRALLNLALVSEGTADFTKAVRGARAFVSEAALALGHEMIQFHGGMGVTDELVIGHGHKRLLVLSRWPDGPDLALDRFAGI
jgi:alkylation response protein AidB-like acyl-CoA dehydrogenase